MIELEDAVPGQLTIPQDACVALDVRDAIQRVVLAPIGAEALRAMLWFEA